MAKHVAVLGGSARANDALEIDPLAAPQGVACADALERAGYRVSRVDWGAATAAALASMKPDAVFLAGDLAGAQQGSVQGLMESLQIPYTHSGVLASALSADRQRVQPTGSGPRSSPNRPACR